MTPNLDQERVERAARAIYEGRNGKGCKPWSLQTKAHKEPYLHDAQACLTAALAADGMASGWQDIATAPKDGTAIDVWFALSESHAARWPNVRWDKVRRRWQDGPIDQGLIHWLATHWQPLPTPPASPGGEG